MTTLKDPTFDFFSFFKRTPDLVCIAGKDGFFKKINPAVIEKLGYTAEELYASPISSFIYSEDKDLTHHNRTSLLGGEVLHNFVNRYLTKAGEIIWLEWTSIYFEDDEIVFAMAKDVTKRKQTEKEVEEKYIKYKSLATHFKSRIEKERKYFAYELHEELAQLAAAIKLDVEFIGKNVPDIPESSKKSITHVIEASGLLINKIQKISSALSPNMLDHIGLAETLEWLCKDFSILHGISCVFESTYDETSLTYEMQIDFLRICQEALRNVTEHSQAARVIISIEDIDDKIQLTIVDDGNGFDIHQQIEASGFTMMRSRVASINGQLTMQSKPGEGTTVCVTVAKHIISQP